MAEDKTSKKDVEEMEGSPAAIQAETGRIPDEPFDVPNKGDDGYETPSGHALAKVGKPEVGADPTSDKERKRGEEYGRIKHGVRSGVIEPK